MTTPIAQAALAAELRRTRQQLHPRHDGDTPPNWSKPSTWEMRLANRRASLRRLITSRKLHRQNFGNAPGWVSVILNLVHCEGGKTDISSINRAARSLGLPPFDLDAFSVIAGGVFGHRLMPAAQCGWLIRLTTLERDELEILDIDAADEPAEVRKKRLARERQRKRRGAPAQAATPSIRSRQPWVELGISERTYWRRKAAGKLA